MNYKFRRERGSVLITALIIAAILAGTILLTFIPMTTTTLKMSQRAFFTTDAVNIAEAGLERGLWAMNQYEQSGYSSAVWNGWTNSTVSGRSALDKTQTFGPFTLSQNASASVKVYVQNYTSSGLVAPFPIVYAEAIIKPTNGRALIKVVKAELGRRSLFGKGGLALNGFRFSGNNPMADSWNSKYTDSGVLRGTPVPYAGGNELTPATAGANNHAKVTLASLYVSTFNGQNADIFGTVSIGADPTTASVTVGPNGRIGPFTEPNGQIDSNSIAYNFTADVPTESAPTNVTYNTISAITASTTFPRTDPVTNVIIDTPTTNPDNTISYYYSVPSITLNGNAASSQLAVSANYNVVLKVTSSNSGNAIAVGGNGAITVNSNATLNIYTSNNISITGTINNTNGSAHTDSITIWGTNTTAGSQSIGLNGGGSLSAVVYAPYANITLNGGASGGNRGDIYGAFVGYTVTFTGNDSFHWDESLATLKAGGTFMPTKWRELVSDTDRAVTADLVGYPAMTYLNSF